MMFTAKDNEMWWELSGIARSEVMLDKIENMLGGLDIPRDHVLWMAWERCCENATYELEAWMEKWTIDSTSFHEGDWLKP